jgi:hypothetical protein
MSSHLRPLTVGLAAMAAAPLVGPACAGQPQPPQPRPLAGCYYFLRGEVAEQLNLPWGVRLLDRPLEGWPAIQQRGDVRRATTLTGVDEQNVPFGYWLRTAHDSIEVGYPGGGGLVLELSAADFGLQGRAREVGDALPPPAARPERRTHPVELAWARCPE